MRLIQRSPRHVLHILSLLTFNLPFSTPPSQHFPAFIFTTLQNMDYTRNPLWETRDDEHPSIELFKANLT